jgi:hypothetical protein
MSHDDAGIPRHQWIIYAAVSGGLLLWCLWQVIGTVTQVLSGEIVIVN